MPTRWRRRAGPRLRTRYNHGEPIRWLGLVPLAGVFAIAAALILMSYGIAPHVLTVALPVPAPDDARPLSPPANLLVIRENGALLWNGEPLSDRELAIILDHHARIEPRHVLLFTPDGKASYARVLEVLGIVRSKGLVDRCFRFSQIARYHRYESPETFDDLVAAQWEDCPPLAPRP